MARHKPAAPRVDAAAADAARAAYRAARAARTTDEGLRVPSWAVSDPVAQAYIARTSPRHSQHALDRVVARVTPPGVKPVAYGTHKRVPRWTEDSLRRSTSMQETRTPADVYRSAVDAPIRREPKQPTLAAAHHERREIGARLAPTL